MTRKLDVSFNSPQCGWMSIGFDDGANEFHTTTAHAPHEKALSELLQILTTLLGQVNGQEGGPVAASEYILKWNRDPEEFDLRFIKDGDNLTLEIYQYPTEERDAAEKELVFTHTGTIKEIADAFAETFNQLHEDRNTDEFEFNWRQPFPYKEFEEFKSHLERG